MDRRAGLVLLLVVGLLAMLVIVASLVVRMSDTVRALSGSEVRLARARLLARSGVAYGAARLVRSPAPVARPGDDWRYREAATLPLARAHNPSLSQRGPHRRPDFETRASGATPRSKGQS